MPGSAEEPEKFTIQYRVDEFSRLTFEQAEAKKVLIRNLKSLVHKVVRINRKNFLRGAVDSSLPLGIAQPGSVLYRRVGDTEWKLDDTNSGLNSCNCGEEFPPLVGMVVAYEVIEKESGGEVALIVAAPNDRFEYRFKLYSSEVEVLDGFPTGG